MAPAEKPVPAGACQIMLSYRVSETGAADRGGDGTTARVRSFLEASGYTVFQDVMALKGGDDFISVLNSAVKGCTVFMPIISSTYADSKLSQWCALPCFFPFFAFSFSLLSVGSKRLSMLSPATAHQGSAHTPSYRQPMHRSVAHDPAPQHQESQASRHFAGRTTNSAWRSSWERSLSPSGTQALTRQLTS